MDLDFNEFLGRFSGFLDGMRRNFLINQLQFKDTH